MQCRVATTVGSVTVLSETNEGHFRISSILIYMTQVATAVGQY
jgi:hypothetical protein